jgi:hypothetical protein
MNKETCDKVSEICDQLLGKEGMDKYPWLLVIGLLCIAFSLRQHRIHDERRTNPATLCRFC